jgi:hypothetical protein
MDVCSAGQNTLFYRSFAANATAQNRADYALANLLLIS